MLKKSNHYKGYILLESLIALSLICVVIGSYISLNTFLLKKNKQSSDQLVLYRVLYEEMKYYENHGGPLIQERYLDHRSFQLRFNKVGNKLIEVEIIDGKESVTIKKE